MSRVVYLHIGAPKTGTTYVQNRLSLNAQELARNGVHYPGHTVGDRSTFHFRAALDLLEQDWGGAPGHAVGSWNQMTRKISRLRGKVIVSHEILAPATPEKVAKAMHDLRRSEVHVVYSVRDLGRQLPAAWQESIKQGRKWTFKRFLEKAAAGDTFFSKAFDLPKVLDTWGVDLPPERVHVVIVPQSRRDPDLLWKRFCQAFGLDPAWLPAESTQANPSLGVVETQLIRQLNRRMGRAVRRRTEYDELIRRLLAERELAHRESTRVTLPPSGFDFAEEQGQAWIDWIKDRGVDVIGRPAELLPKRPADEAKWVDPDKVRPAPLLGAALDALEAMTREAANRPAADRDLASRVKSGAKKLRSR